MRRRRGTLERWALEAGLPARKAKSVVAAEIDPSGGPLKFVTFEEWARHMKMWDLATLRWFLDLAQGAPIDESKIGARVALLITPYWEKSAQRPRVPDNLARRAVSSFVADLRKFVAKRGTEDKWKIVFRKVSRTLSWGEIRTGTPSFHQSADWVSAFLLKATELIDTYGHHIRNCAYSVCGKLFVADDVRRQKFCSRECGASDRQRRFRAKLASKGKNLTEYRREGRLTRKTINADRAKPQRLLQAEIARRLSQERPPAPRLS